MKTKYVLVYISIYMDGRSRVSLLFFLASPVQNDKNDGGFLVALQDCRLAPDECTRELCG